MPSLSKPSDKASFRRLLLAWYRRDRRALPWRETRDPYAIWVSEIMLQQTRVAVVIERYRRFLKRFPTVKRLAAAPLDDVLAEWSGLGYYNRARAMHRAAQQIAHERNGRFPATHEELLALPGIGSYTAAAIASIAFGQPHAVVDGNVERVMSRLAGKRLSRGETQLHAQYLLSIRSAGDFNQAMMELGATVCTPVSPYCHRCPVFAHCATRGELPRETPAQPQRKQQESYVLARRNGSVRLVQRSASERRMAGLWELPRLTASPSAEPLMRVAHAITNTNYQVSVFAANGGKYAGRWVPLPKAAALPLTGLARKVLRRAGLIR